MISKVFRIFRKVSEGDVGYNAFVRLSLSCFLTTWLLIILVFSLQVSAAEKEIRLGFFSDIHFDIPKKENTEFGGVGDDELGVRNFKIPVQAKSTIETIKPDYLFDSGDMTDHGRDNEYRAYRNWKSAIDSPIYSVMGNHDREHRNPNAPYGTGFYSICEYNSATRVLKLGNLVFIMISEDHHYEFNALDGVISDQKFRWIEKQLDKYAQGKNNVFIMEHYPIKNTVAWSDYFYGLGGFSFFGSAGWFDWWWKPWERMSRRWKRILKEYEQSVVAHISGHIHIPFGWRDVPEDRKIYEYGDGDHVVENVGQFVSGEKISNSERDHPPYQLPEVYFLNIRGLNYRHQVAARFEPRSAIYYTDLTQGSKHFTLNAVDIVTEKKIGSYHLKTSYPVNIGDGAIQFVNSDLGIRRKDNTVEITEENWFEVKKGESGWVTFQKSWKEKVNINEVNVISDSGRHGRIYFKGSSNGGQSWRSWTTEPPENVNVLQLRTCFWASAKDGMEVKDVKVEVSSR